MTLILFVCRGNTCRSPMAEVAARAAAARAGLGGTLRFASAGTRPMTLNATADPRAMACVEKAGLDLSAHRPRRVSTDMIHAADAAFALDRSVLQHLHALMPDHDRARISLLLHLVPSLHLDDIADPYDGTAADYEHAFQLIQQAVAALVEKFR